MSRPHSPATTPYAQVRVWCPTCRRSVYRAYVPDRTDGTRYGRHGACGTVFERWCVATQQRADGRARNGHVTGWRRDVASALRRAG